MKVDLVNKKTGEIKDLEIGFSIWIFIFGCIPLFFRKMWGWATFLMIMTLIATQDSTYMSKDDENAFMFSMVIFLVLAIYLAVNGNKLYAIKLFNEGWTFRNPDSESAAMAREKWKIEKI
jgi:hypothetical protein